ncbi:BA75_05029T0 [Komagataella pastoris]|uniref:Nucleolar protein 16 n=1 Tax=Komagataella pastoris TaxID=4922 RepID=A0A1B2JIT4_PICPA|nr:BA75_05029T0 [Komagataella pastoris]
MVSVRRRKSNHSGNSKVSVKVKDKQRRHFASNKVLRAHWDSKLTMSQNYAKLGLRLKLGKPTGGVEKPLAIEKGLDGKKHDKPQKEDENIDDFYNSDGEIDPERIPEGRAHIVRDESGEVVKIVYGTKVSGMFEQGASEKEEPAQESVVINELMEVAQAKPEKPPKRLTELEEIWVEGLRKKYGNDYERMKWDRKLNPMLLTPGKLQKLFERKLLVDDYDRRQRAD